MRTTAILEPVAIWKLAERHFLCRIQATDHKANASDRSPDPTDRLCPQTEPDFSPELPLFDQAVETWCYKHRDELYSHSTHAWNGHWLHHVRAAPLGKENWQ